MSARITRHVGNDLRLSGDRKGASHIHDECVQARDGAGTSAADHQINLIDRQVEAYSDPQPDGYRLVRVFRSGEDVPVFVAGIEVGRIMVTDLLP